MRSVTILLGTVGLAFLPTTVSAFPVTWEFAGEITSVFDENDLLGGGVRVGSPFSGSFTFESTTPDSSPANARNGAYLDAIMTISGHIGLIPFAGAANGNNRISVQDNVLGGIIDDYCVTVDVDLTSEILYFSLRLSDVTGMAFSDDSLLLSPPDIGLFSLANIRFVRGAEDIDLSGQLTSLIPEPGTLLLLCLGVVAVMSRRKRKRTRVLIGFGVVVLLSFTVTTEVRAQWTGGPVLIGGDDTDHHFGSAGEFYIREGFNFLGTHVANGKTLAVCIGCNRDDGQRK